MSKSFSYECLKWGFSTLLLFSIIFGYIYSNIADDRGFYADNANHLMQSLSIYFDHDLIYSRTDLANLSDLGYGEVPKGLFLNKVEDTFFYAKQFGYSLILSFFYSISHSFGPYVANAVITTSLILLMYVSLYLKSPSKRSKISIIPILASSIICSPILIWSRVIHPDLLISFLLLLSVFLIGFKSRIALVIASIAFGLALFEKPPFLIFFPAFVYLSLLNHGKRHLMIVLVIIFSTFLLLSSFFALTTGKLSSYQGERWHYQTPPFINDITSEGLRIKTDKYFTINYFFNSSIDGISHFHRTLNYYFFGLQTGVLFYFPMMLAVIPVLLFIMFQKLLNKSEWIIFLSLLFYSVAYMLFLSDNYFGGSESFGNRYFLQVYPLWIWLAPWYKVKSKIIFVWIIFCIMISITIYFLIYSSPNSSVKNRYKFLVEMNHKIELPIEKTMLSAVLPYRFERTNFQAAYIVGENFPIQDYYWTDGNNSSKLLLVSKHSLNGKSLTLKIHPSPKILNYQIINGGITTTGITATDSAVLEEIVIDEFSSIKYMDGQRHYVDLEFSVKNPLNPTEELNIYDSRILGIPIDTITLDQSSN